jgi:hypothetical protein
MLLGGIAAIPIFAAEFRAQVFVLNRILQTPVHILHGLHQPKGIF